MSSDGTNKKKINNERSYFIIVKDDWIYYSTIEYKGINIDNIEFHIKKIKLEGTNKIDIVNESAKNIDDTNMGYFYLHDGWIFYQSMSDMNKLYKISIDGTQKTKVTDEIISNKYAPGTFIVNGSWLYYIQSNVNNKLYKMKTDGTSKELVINSAVGDINIVGDNIFYTSESDGYKLYKANLDGTKSVKLSDFSVSDINLIGNWIYCRDFYSEVKYYKFSLDEIGSVIDLKGNP